MPRMRRLLPCVPRSPLWQSCGLCVQACLRYHVRMMGYGGGGGLMAGAGTFGLITGLVILADLVLVGIWLWQQISKK